MTQFHIRRAQPGDEEAVLALLRELADYEELLHLFQITAEIVRRDYLGERPMLQCDLVVADGAPAGLASWYWMYSSFAAKRAIYLEDLFVRPAFRGRGFGKALLVHLARTAVEAGAIRVEWEVLDWNTPSIDFYERLGAKAQSGWRTYRLEGEALGMLGA
jgi:GNAT superfamily N-acetyltransferase